jgi:hypothetical protein
VRHKKLAAITFAGASAASLYALGRSGLLPKVDTAKARDAVSFSRYQGRHTLEDTQTEDGNFRDGQSS